MDLRTIKEYALILRRELIAKGVIPTAILLFGSYAKNSARSNSDIDIAVVSRQFGFDRIAEGAMLNLIASKIDSRIEAIPLSLESYLDIDSHIPIVYEIQKTSVCLL